MEKIEKRLARAAEYVRQLGYVPAYVSLYGSQNYGLAIESENYHSDYDFKCIVLPSLRDLAEERDCASLTVSFEGGLIDIKDIRLFVKLIERMNPAYLECLLTEYHLTLEGGEAVDRMKTLLPELFAGQGAGFARVCRKLFLEKKKRMCQRSPAQAENIDRFGYDLKQVHHMYRLLVMIREFERSGMMRLIVPEYERTMLFDLKAGKYVIEEVCMMVQKWQDEMTAIEERIVQTRGKDKPLKQFMQFVRQAIYEHCRKEVLENGNLSD